jgi:hypothetical protein
MDLSFLTLINQPHPPLPALDIQVKPINSQLHLPPAHLHQLEAAEAYIVLAEEEEEVVVDQQQ